MKLNKFDGKCVESECSEHIIRVLRCLRERFDKSFPQRDRVKEELIKLGNTTDNEEIKAELARFKL